ncbi:ribonuclease H2, subunit B [Pyronema omphalodes]|nr:ribonuclease H2, subunit B [Pyronema omphalodes]
MPSRKKRVVVSSRRVLQGPHQAPPRTHNFQPPAMARPKVVLLPSTTSSETLKIFTLPHPRTKTLAKFVIHPTSGLHELTAVSTPSSQPKSWLITSEDSTDNSTEWINEGQLISEGTLYIATPFDPLFLLIPLLLPESTKKQLSSYLPLQDLLDSLELLEQGSDFSALTALGNITHTHISRRLQSICDSVDAGGEPAYRVSQDKVLKLLAKKCVKMAENLPSSLEEEYVKKPLVRPVTEVTLAKTTATTVEVKEGVTKEVTERMDVSMTGVTEVTAKIEETKIAETQVTTQQTTDPVILQLLRLRVSFNFLSSLYIPTHITALLQVHLSTLHDFTKLDSYLEELKKLRTDAAAARQGDFSMKRRNADEEIDGRAEKKRKLEEEEKKKAKNVSRGVKELSKVNTRGMSKITGFFKKKA